MKKLYVLSLAILLCLNICQAHNHHNEHHSHSDNHEHHHSHDSDHHHHLKSDSHSHHETDFKTKNTDNLIVWDSGFSFINYYMNLSENKYIMVVYSVILVSLPSVPVFIVLGLVSKLVSKKEGNILSPFILRPMLSLAVGSLVGDVLFCMIDHLKEERGHEHTHNNEGHHNHNHGNIINNGLFFIIVGIFAFYAFDRLWGGEHQHNHDHHHHENENKKEISISEKKNESKIINNKSEKNENLRQRFKPEQITEKDKHDSHSCEDDSSNSKSVFLYLLADFLHNVIDGLAIGVSFSINNKIGVATTLAIGIHELPHEIGDFAVLISNNKSLSYVMATQIMTATGALFGGMIGLSVANYNTNSLLGFTAGGFLYLALSKMIPELNDPKHKGSAFGLLIELIFGLIGAYLIMATH